MAQATEPKIDAAKAEVAAEKAYAAAAAAVEVKAEPKAAAKPAAKVEAKVEAKTATKPAAKKAKPAPVAKKAAAKVAVKKAEPKKVAVKKAAKPAAKTTKVAKAAKRAAAATPVSKLKDALMAQTKKTQTAAEDFTARVKDAMTEAQDRARAAFEKGNEYFGEYGEFAKGNIEAVIESGKIFATGVQALGKDYVAEGKNAFETLTADVKELAAVKSPTDFFKLQGEILRRNFDAAVAAGSKNSEAIVKLANDAFAPIQNRVSLAIDKVKQAA